MKLELTKNQVQILVEAVFTQKHNIRKQLKGFENNETDIWVQEFKSQKESLEELQGYLCSLIYNI